MHSLTKEFRRLRQRASQDTRRERTAPRRRRTDQRAAIRRVMLQARGPLSTQDVLAAAQNRVPGLGIATVYRNVRLLADEGWLRPIDIPGQPSRYELAEKKHHHHFQCDECGRVFDVAGCSPGLSRGTPKRFAVERHEVLLYGHCPDCA